MNRTVVLVTKIFNTELNTAFSIKITLQNKLKKCTKLEKFFRKQVTRTDKK